MWAVVVEGRTPRNDQRAGMTQVVEQVFNAILLRHTRPKAAFHHRS